MIPVETFSNELEELLVVGFKISGHLEQQVWLHSRLGSALAGTETLVANTAPLSVRPLHLLPPAVEPLGLVEVEVVLGQLMLQAQEPLKVVQLDPRRRDEGISVHDVDLLSGEKLQPP